MAAPGRKPKFNDRVRDKILALTKQGKTLKQIAQVIGVSRQAIYLWMGDKPELAYELREARQVADELVEASLFSRAVGYSHPETKVMQYEGQVFTQKVKRHYPPDTQAAMFWLRNRQPKRWKEKTEGDVKVEVSPPLTDEQLEAKITEKLAALEANEPRRKD